MKTKTQPRPKQSPTKARYASAAVLSECLKIALAGDPDGLLDDSVPMHKLVRRMVGELCDGREGVQVWQMHRLLEIVWDRIEGRVPDKLEIDAQIRGVIALPVVSSSALDWSADAVRILGARSAHAGETIDIPMLASAPSSDQDE